MYGDIKRVKPLPDYKIYVEIVAGRKGIFDVTPYLDFGVFRELRDINYFNQASVDRGSVTWPHKQEISLETLRAEMQPIDKPF
jgi:hypothetical protein